MFVLSPSIKTDASEGICWVMPPDRPWKLQGLAPLNCLTTSPVTQIITPGVLSWVINKFQAHVAVAVLWRCRTPQIVHKVLLCFVVLWFYYVFLVEWWRHQMETFSALLAICARNSSVTDEFPAQRQVTRSFDVFFHLRFHKRFGKQSWGWWFETHRPHYNVIVIDLSDPFIHIPIVSSLYPPYPKDRGMLWFYVEAARRPPRS